MTNNKECHTQINFLQTVDWLSHEEGKMTGDFTWLHTSVSKTQMQTLLVSVNVTKTENFWLVYLTSYIHLWLSHWRNEWITDRLGPHWVPNPAFGEKNIVTVYQGGEERQDRQNMSVFIICGMQGFWKSEEHLVEVLSYSIL